MGYTGEIRIAFERQPILHEVLGTRIYILANLEKDGNMTQKWKQQNVSHIHINFVNRTKLYLQWYILAHTN